ncbi:MAG: NAD(P) transhydrogenase subunit alpha [Deltaproteobacteria bacterium RIFCSPLOWO2_12_FULL_40_28]|nr:MAG: NAD(P) transhydrogenase subunit alpha [Deltaproteobacteria bacterium RIFCSPHIGHO2_02_FULL_40_28]OGQ20794.1 MAG: NAD(P) transhydrogenase subunit alpha [Deltaproteobacteria bacterium RIFCSPHIGHO2_12_FULL_40_32]OGQ39195.1 MAG: NAD(P) transhydrogenase subunit alpha [Deltaproteobacteria bacterium RIFCSPLOWO2_02_FULL_40_36]OGQ54475.1 MAG: NAD(P) transhydrogenase subunit alpha [Deltaproteobacteria bacterium RIFCSPLOWO2_12_FULL_40_28]
MKLEIRKEKGEEKRVALTPDSAQKLIKKGHVVMVEATAGMAAGFSDADYQKAGASLEIANTDVRIAIHTPPLEEIKAGSLLMAVMNPLGNPELVKKLAATGVTAVALDLIPRTTLAQSMDVLSSQANLAGYWAVVVAASKLPRIFPMMTTAAGTITPAKVLILGAGVAGLQAVATAKRLGAVVEVFDVRRVVKEQVMSLGGRFIEVSSTEDAAGEGGYAKETSEAYQQQQKELIAKHVAKSDVVITTALIPGKKAPTLVTKEMVYAMKPGSVMVDLASEQGGNIELCEPGTEVEIRGVKILGYRNVPRFLPFHASQMFGKNIENLLSHLSHKDGSLKLDFNDEITKGCVLTHEGKIIHEKFK